MPADPTPQLAVLLLEAHEPQRILDGQQQLVGGDRLLEKIERAQPCGADGHIHRRLAGNHDDGRHHAELAQVGEHRQAVLARHHHVGEHQVEPLLLEQRDRALGVVADDRLVAGQPERSSDRRQRRRVVVDNQHARHASPSRGKALSPAGSSMWKVVPRPGVLSTQTLPK